MSDSLSAEQQQEVDLARSLLRQVIDPEIGVNIIDLGLVYRIDPQAEQLLIEMTMTSPACPMGEMIMDEVEFALTHGLPPQRRIHVNLVWEPAWSPERMSEDSRRHFGWQA